MKITENSLVAVTSSMVEAVQAVIGAADIQVIESLMEIVTKDVDAIKDRVIQTKADSAEVTGMVKRLKTNKKELDAKRKELSDPHRLKSEQINGFYNQFTAAAAIGISEGEANIGTFIVRQQKIDAENERIEREAVAKKARDDAEALRKKADEALEVAVDDESYDEGMRDVALDDAEAAEAQATAIETAPVVEKKIITRVGSGVNRASASVTYNYSAKIIDITKIPEHVLDVPKVMEAITKELNSIAKKRMEGFSVPGAELVKTPKTNIR